MAANQIPWAGLHQTTLPLRHLTRCDRSSEQAGALGHRPGLEQQTVEAPGDLDQWRQTGCGSL